MQPCHRGDRIDTLSCSPYSVTRDPWKNTIVPAVAAAAAAAELLMSNQSVMERATRLDCEN